MNTTEPLRALAEAGVPHVPVDTSQVIPRARRRRRLRRGTSLVALSTVVATALWVAGERPWEAPATVLPAATATATAPTPTSAPTPEPVLSEQGPYWYVLTENVSSEAAPIRGERWIGNDSPGVSIADGNLDSVSDFGPAHWGILLLHGQNTLITWSVLDTLPTEPDALERVLWETVEAEDDASEQRVFERAQTLLTETPASPDLRQALWTVIERLTITTDPVAAVDAAGRAGMAITAADLGPDGWLHSITLVKDEATDRLLQVEEFGLAPGGKTQHTSRTTYLEERIAQAPPIEPDLIRSGCGDWATC